MDKKNKLGLWVLTILVLSGVGYANIQGQDGSLSGFVNGVFSGEVNTSKMNVIGGNISTDGSVLITNGTHEGGIISQGTSFIVRTMPGNNQNLRLQTSDSSAHIGLSVGARSYSTVTIMTDVNSDGYVQVRGNDMIENTDSTEYGQLLMADDLFTISTGQGNISLMPDDSMVEIGKNADNKNLKVNGLGIYQGSKSLQTTGEILANPMIYRSDDSAVLGGQFGSLILQSRKGAQRGIRLVVGNNAETMLWVDEDGVQIGNGSSQKNITLTSPDGTEFSCGVNNSGVFSCS